MFHTPQQVTRRHGKNALGRFQYIQRLVSEYQSSSNIITQRQVLANIANFAYDPINYDHLRALHVVPDLFLDAIDEEDILLVRFGLGGIANCSVDPINVSLLLQEDCLETICHHFISEDKETIINALVSIVTMLEQEEVIRPYLEKNQKRIETSLEEQLKEFNEKDESMIKNLAIIALQLLPDSETPMSKETSLCIGPYVLGKTLGIGTFGKVKLGVHQQTGYKVAVKILNREKIKSLSMDTKIKREIQILKLFRHPHIIKLYEVIETHTDIFMIMEYVGGGELFEHIVQNGRLPEDEARGFFQQIIASIDYCHRHRVVHRDLKPENVLLDGNETIKIADFGLSNLMRDGDLLKTPCGSPNYAAPEVISGQLYAGPEVDVWSCGIILFALLCAKLPFDDDYIPDLFKKIRAGVFTFPPHVSEECKQLIGLMLVVDQLKRGTIPEIIAHPWVKKNWPAHLNNIPLLEPSTDSSVPVPSSTTTTGIPFSPPMNLRDALPFDSESSFFYSKEPELPDLCGTTEQMWKLGISSNLPPKEILSHLYHIMIGLGIEWKVINEYHLWCRTPPNAMANPESTTKFTIQLFQVKNKSHIIDLKKLKGDTCSFFEFCSQLRCQFNQLPLT